MQRRHREYRLIFVGLLLLLCLITLAESAIVTIPVGVILDSKSPLGDTARDYINFALQNFYSTYHSYETRLQLHFNDSGTDLLTAVSAASDMINNKKVHAILGPQNSEQARYIVELGIKYDVPVIWFSPSGPSLLPPLSRFFINSNSIISSSSRSHCFQFEAIAAIIQAYNWQSVIPIYEDPEFGYDLIPCLTYALQDMDTRMPYISAIRQNFTDDEINEELDKIRHKRKYVLIVHMTVDLWSRLVKQAQVLNMMNEGYAWVLTQGLSSMMDQEAEDIYVNGLVNGTLGVRPAWIVSNDLASDLARTLMSKYKKSLSLYGLWASDTVTALAVAVEKAGLVNYTFRYRNETGQELRIAIWDTNFTGWSGNFSLGGGQLEPSKFRVYNVQGQIEMVIGYWSPEAGLRQNFSNGELVGEYNLRKPIWPGNTKDIPPKLRIGVLKTLFTELVNVSPKNRSATGFAVDVFCRVLDVLPFNLSYDFVPVPVNSTNEGVIPFRYDDLLCNISTEGLDVDVLIGDITIVVSRTNCVDFTMPYLDSSVSMVVKVRSVDKSGWILFKPFDRSLWLILSAVLVAATVIVFILEGRKKDYDGSKYQHFVNTPFLIYMSDVGNLRSRTSKWVVIVVMFLLALALQVYTANLTSFLNERTVAKLPPWADMQVIKRNNKTVGYQSDSWVKDLLIHQIGLKKDQLRPLDSRENYSEALFKEDKDVLRVDAIVDETPYLYLLLKRCSSCKMTGPIYKAGGFAFAFPKNSTLVSNFSVAILNVTQNIKTFSEMKDKAFLPVAIDKTEFGSEVQNRGLKLNDFGGLFIIILIVLVLFVILPILKVTSFGLWWQKKFVSFLSPLIVPLYNKFVSFLSPSGGVILAKR